MANRRMDPQNMVEEIVRTTIYQHTFWKEQCFDLTAETLVDKAMELDHIGGTFGGNRTPTPFICLILKMLQLQPEKDIVVEFIKNHDYKYVRILGAFYLRLTGSDADVYCYLEPLYNDYRKLRQKLSDGMFSLTHVDEVIEELLTKDYSCDIAMPRLEKRWTLEQNGSLEPRKSVFRAKEKEETEGIAEESEDEKDHHPKSPERERDTDRRPDSHRHRFSGPQFCDIGETSSSAKRSKTEFSEGIVDSVPHDLQMKIAEEFPVKSLLRFLSVSKLWESTFRNQDFRDLYLSKSLTRSPERQGLLFTFACGDKCFVFSSPRLENANEVSSSSAASYNLTCDSPSRVTIAPSVHGLICYGPASGLVLYNPCTRESVSLPSINLEMQSRIDHCVGYDPVDSVYKVLCVAHVMADEADLGMVRVLTLGNEHEDLWRMVENVPHHSPTFHEMCIDGVLYYGAFTDEGLTQPSIMRFDVRSEEFELIIGPANVGVEFLTPYSKLTSYQEKLGVIFMEDGVVVVLWVLEDGQWSKTSFDLPSLLGFTTDLDLQLFSGTNAGEIILAPVLLRASTFRVVYYDPKKNNFKKIEIEGLTWSDIPHKDAWYCRTVSVFPYQVENLLFLKAKRD